MLDCDPLFVKGAAGRRSQRAHDSQVNGTHLPHTISNEADKLHNCLSEPVPPIGPAEGSEGEMPEESRPE
jgi:hypothetical protein